MVIQWSPTVLFWQARTSRHSVTRGKLELSDGPVNRQKPMPTIAVADGVHRQPVPALQLP